MFMLRGAIALVLLIVLSSCSEDAPPPLPAQQVLVANVLERDYKPNYSFVGQIKAISDIAVLPKVSGYLEEIAFKEGQVVNKGDLLFRVDAKPFQATLNQAKAELAGAEASKEVAVNNYQRGKELIAGQFISQAELDDLKSRSLSAQAAVAKARALVEEATLNLNYTDITAAFSGRIDKSVFAVGDLVSSSGGALTSLTSIDPIRVEFTVTEKLFLLSKRQQDKRNAQGATGPIFQVWVKLSDDYQYEFPGVIDFVSNRVDRDTGTVRVRAELPNKDGDLRPGMHAIAVLETLETTSGLFVPGVSVQSDQQGNFVYTIDEKNIAHKTYVELSETKIDDLMHVVDGLTQSDRVVTKGLQRLRTGQEVDIAEAKPYKSKTADGE